MGCLGTEKSAEVGVTKYRLDRYGGCQIHMPRMTHSFTESRLPHTILTTICIMGAFFQCQMQFKKEFVTLWDVWEQKKVQR